MASNEKYTILYGRLSQEDTQKANKADDSNSIQNQKLLLGKYAAEKGFTNTIFLSDDGYSGTNFDRPGWQQLMENGQVETLIVKDMSQLGREYLQVGQYTELIFPSYGVRFIAVTDGVDSLYESTNDFTPFRNLMMAEQNIFSGSVYCMDCGGTMVLHRAHTMDAVKNNFMCSTYKKKGKDVCSGHYIREQELSAIILDDIRRITHFARQNELRFAEHIRKKQGKEAQQEITMFQKKIDAMQKRQAQLTKLFKRLYEDSVLGRIPDEQYRILSQEYTTEQKEIQEQLPIMEARLQELKDSSSKIARFIENAKRYSEIPELTSEILRIFIKRVEVGERAEKYSRTAPQEVRIYYRDIGLVDELPQSMSEAVAEVIPDNVV